MNASDAVPAQGTELRAHIAQEIKDTARRLLVEGGHDAVKLRAIAREMGLTAPALYRYYDSRDALLTALIVDLYDELSETVRSARASADGDGFHQLEECSKAFRSWALAHPSEYGLVFGSPVLSVEVVQNGTIDEAGRRFGMMFAETFAVLAASLDRPLVAEDLSESYRQHLRTLAALWGTPDLPPELAQVFLSAWVRVFGLISMEVYGHLQFVASHSDDMFAAELADIRRGLEGCAPERPPPGNG